MVRSVCPGAEPGSIDVTVETNVVTDRPQRRGPCSETLELVVRERDHGTFSRQVFIGDNLGADCLSADYHAGVRRLSIPMHPSAKPRRIQAATADTPLAVTERR